MVKIENLSRDKDDVFLVYNVTHSTPGRNGTTLEQRLKIQRINGEWSANIEQNGINEKTSTAAAWKLGDWLTRLGNEIKNHEYSEININSL